MKKLFIVLAVATLGFVACNSEGEGETSTFDSAAYKDSIAKEKIKADSIAAAAAALAQDTTGKKDSAK